MSAPTEPGHYWWRDSDDWTVVCVDHLRGDSGALVMWFAGNECEEPLDRGDDHEWGPRIPSPEAIAWTQAMLNEARDLVPTVYTADDGEHAEDYNDDEGIAWHEKLEKGPPL